MEIKTLKEIFEELKIKSFTKEEIQKFKDDFNSMPSDELFEPPENLELVYPKQNYEQYVISGDEFEQWLREKSKDCYAERNNSNGNQM